MRLLLLYMHHQTTQVDNLGTLVPHLTELRFGRGSTLASFRDLGSSLLNLRVLWLSACGVGHLDGVGALAGLEELYLSFNDVEDVTSIALHDRLEVSKHTPRTLGFQGSLQIGSFLTGRVGSRRGQLSCLQLTRPDNVILPPDLIYPIEHLEGRSTASRQNASLSGSFAKNEYACVFA